MVTNATMINMKLDQSLSSHEVVAKNYGADHANKIHSDDGAAKYGFAGALVPGVGLYAYMTRPVVDLLGLEWLECGAMKAKFFHPIYDGEIVRIASRIGRIDPIELSIELFNQSSNLSAAGMAGMPSMIQRLDPGDYPHRPLPEQLRPATIDSFCVGDLLGSLEFKLDWAGRIVKFLDDVVETSPIYRDPEAVCHPAFWIAQANEILMQNVALGPWVHTASETQHYSMARDGEQLSMRGRVVDLYQKRGNEYVVLDLGIFAELDRPIAKIKHAAIIKLREPGE